MQKIIVSMANPISTSHLSMCFPQSSGGINFIDFCPYTPQDAQRELSAERAAFQEARGSSESSIKFINVQRLHLKISEKTWDFWVWFFFDEKPWICWKNPPVSDGDGPWAFPKVNWWFPTIGRPVIIHLNGVSRVNNLFWGTMTMENPNWGLRHSQFFHVRHKKNSVDFERGSTLRFWRRNAINLIFHMVRYHWMVW